MSVVTTESQVSEDSLSRLLDDPAFQEIHNQMDSFNLFEAVGAVRGELRHSNFLAYLLSPSRSHGLGTAPLVAVLRAILEMLAPPMRPVMTLELIVGELGDATVYRERDSIDLLIDIASLNLVVVIENKVDSKAGDGQLERYRVTVEARYPSRKKLYVYLTPHGADPDHNHYVAFSYVRLAEILASLVDRAPSETAIIIRHYVEMLRRHIVPDERLKELASKLYEQHSEALDFIFECRPKQAGILDVMRDRISAVSGLTIDSQAPNILRFAPDIWDHDLKSIKCDPTVWTKSGRALLFEVKTYNNSGRVNLALVLGPAEAASRAALYEAARKRPDVFTGLVKPMGQTWSTIYSRDLITNEQARDLSFAALGFNVQAAWGDFQGQHLQAIINAILEIDSESAS
jgi:hypothetical protein